MRKLIILAVIIIITAQGLFAAKTDDMESIAYINGFEGDCELKRKGEEIGFTVQDIYIPLYEGDTVITGTGSKMEVVFDDATILKLDRNSRLVIKKLKRKKKVETLLELVKGRLFAVVNKLKKKEEFGIKTKMAWAAVKGTEFVVQADDDSRIGVYEGKVAVSAYDMKGNLRHTVVLDKDKETRIEKRLKHALKSRRLSRNFARKYKDIKDIRDKIKYVRELRRNGKIKRYKLERKLKRIENLKFLRDSHPRKFRKYSKQDRQLVNEIIKREAYYKACLEVEERKERKTKARIKKYLKSKKDKK